MRILGIDPGLERIGYALIVKEGSSMTCPHFGLITTPRISLHDRLLIVHQEMSALMEKCSPDAFVTEKLLFSVNRKTALDVSKSLGVLLLTAGSRGLPWTEYTPPEVKLSVVGNGGADKHQVQYMVIKLLKLTSAPKPDDVADAMAIGICHALRSGPINAAAGAMGSLNRAAR